MRCQLVKNCHTELLNRILCKIVEKYPLNRQTITSNFYATVPSHNCQDNIYAIGMKQDKVCIIYALHTEYKFTRGMDTVCHTEELINEVSIQEAEEFRKWLVQVTTGYKVLALGVKHQGVFKPHQQYMEVADTPHL